MFEKIDVNGPNAHPLSKSIKGEVASPNPIVKRTSEKVGRQFEERVSRIEEQLHRFLHSGLERTSIKEKILEEVIWDVKKIDRSGEKLSREAMTSNGDTDSIEHFDRYVSMDVFLMFAVLELCSFTADAYLVVHM